VRRQRLLVGGHPHILPVVWRQRRAPIDVTQA
jgi:hypothetical protein